MVLSLVSDPTTFNPLLAIDPSSRLVCSQVAGYLFTRNNLSQEIEPGLAKSWKPSEDGKEFTMWLRDGIRFSDDKPFTADDVLFTLNAILSGEVNTPYKTDLEIDGQPPRVKALDAHTLQLTFSAGVTSPVEVALARIPILPKHALAPFTTTKSLAKAWSIKTPGAAMPSLGPFVIKEYHPKQRLVLQRNPQYWRFDKAGKRLPYLNQVTFLISNNYEAHLNRFRSGETDLVDQVNPADLEKLSGADVKIVDVGPAQAVDVLWFNLNDRLNPITRDPLVEPYKLVWFKNENFRKAISYAINRHQIIEQVYEKKAAPVFSLIAQENKLWYQPPRARYDYNLTTAQKLLIDAKFTIDNVRFKDPILYGPNKVPVQFNLIIDGSNATYERMAAILESDFKKLGIAMTVLALEPAALWEKILRAHAFDAALLSLEAITEPIAARDFLCSRGFHHLWYPLQSEPANGWEAAIDALMTDFNTTADLTEKQKTFAQVQTILYERYPVIPMLRRNLVVGCRNNVQNLKPSNSGALIWNSWEISIRR
jgi:peptide/nickel transport system substrate-binding protein